MNPKIYQSRLQRKQDRLTQRQAVMFTVASIGLIILLIVFGIPALFKLTTAISSLGPKTPQIVQDQTAPPDSPRLSPDYSATSSAQILVRGASDPKQTVELFQNDRSLGTTVSGGDGSFSFDVTLDKGENTFTAQAISDSGKRSEKSEPYTVTYTTNQPKLELNLKDGDTVSDPSLQISGNTDPGNSVSVNDHLVIVQSSGAFAYTLTLQNGDNKIKITASDQAGNQTSKEITIKFSQ